MTPEYSTVQICHNIINILLQNILVVLDFFMRIDNIAIDSHQYQKSYLQLFPQATFLETEMLDQMSRYFKALKLHCPISPKMYQLTILFHKDI